MIKILFFAKYREKFGAPAVEISASGLASVGALIQHMKRHFPAAEGILGDQNLIISVNQELAGMQTSIKSGDEVAFFPPVTGG
jgi:sulfur-carrier protein